MPPSTTTTSPAPRWCARAAPAAPPPPATSPSPAGRSGCCASSWIGWSRRSTPATGHWSWSLDRGPAVLGLERLDQVVLAEALVAVAALDQRVGERLEVAGGLPDPRGHDDGRVLADHVVAQLHDRAPPGPLDVVLQLDPERTVVVARTDPAVDLARLEGEAAASGQVDDGVHGVGGHRACLPVCRRRWLRRRFGRCRYRAMLPRGDPDDRPDNHTPTGCQTVLVSRKAAIQ